MLSFPVWAEARHNPTGAAACPAQQATPAPKAPPKSPGTLSTRHPQVITTGNPALKPELTNNVELGLSRTIKKTFISATFYTRITNNAITQISQPSDTLAGAIVTTFQNIGRQRTYGTNIFTNVAATSKINIGVFFNAFYTSLTGQIIGGQGLSQELTNTGFVVSGGSFASAQFAHGWGVQAFGFMQGNTVQLQGTQGGFAFYTLGVKKDIANKKGSIGLAGENFFANRFNIHTVLNSPQFTQVNDVYLYNRGIRLTFTYKIGKMTMEAPRKKAKGVNNDDVKSDGNGSGQAPAGGGAPTGGAPRQ